MGLFLWKRAFRLIQQRLIVSCFPFLGHACVPAPEIHTAEVQQLLRVSLVGVLLRLVSGHVISGDDSSHHGLETRQRKRDSVGGQWWLSPDLKQLNAL